ASSTGSDISVSSSRPNFFVDEKSASGADQPDNSFGKRPQTPLIRHAPKQQHLQFQDLLRIMQDHYERQQNACLPPQVLQLQRTIITLCVAVMILNLTQLMLDSMSIRNRHLDLLRRM